MHTDRRRPVVPLHVERELQPAERAPALTRRAALQLMAASVALANGACTRAPRERIVPYVDMPEAGVNGEPVYYATAFVRDGHAHGVLVGTREGRPIKVEGNPSHPSSLGATDVHAQASILELWDPDRAQAVRERLPGTAGAAVSTWSAFEAAWRARAVELARDGGAGLRLLTAPFTSPTLHAQVGELLQRYPNARWHRQDAPLTAAARAGARLAFGHDVGLVSHLDRARFVAAFDADPFSHGPGSVRCARDWSGQRAGNGGGLPVTMAAEVAPGLFGARADARVALAPHAIEALLWRVGAQLVSELRAAAVPPAADAATARFERRLVAGLRAHGADALLVAGPALGARSHALVHLLNQRLGAFGRGVDAIAPLDGGDRAGSLADLAADMQAGAVGTLLILDANPVYDAPGDVPFAAALARVPFSARLGLHDDETARACTWQLPATHVYEQWSDARAHDGSATPIQPAIAPLYDTRSAHELLTLIGTDDTPDAHARVRRQWRDGAPAGADFEAFWNESLRNGVLAGSAAAPLALPPAAIPPPPAFAAPADALATLLVADASVATHAAANNAWLQELPRPFTKLTWDNALHLGPATARALRLETGDVVRASAGAAAVDVPVWVLAGHAEGAASLALGYGRRAAGRVGVGVGVDAHPFVSASGAPVALRLAPLGRRHAFAVTQHETAQHDRDLARTVRPGAPVAPPEPAHPSLYPAPPRAGPQWAMAIDLDACIGCNACTVACQAENNIPVVGAEEVARGRHMQWIRIDRYEHGDGGSLFQPVPCMHCENAPCEVVCPVGATVHDSEGLNLQVYNRCIGTRFCSNNCPYKVRRFNFLQYADITTESLAAQRNPDVTVRARGVMEKCTYCLQRLARARHHADRTGTALRDGDVVTACQGACPTRAIHFGDLGDPGADVVRAKASPRHYALLGELNTRPRTTYLARVIADDPAEGAS